MEPNFTSLLRQLFQIMTVMISIGNSGFAQEPYTPERDDQVLQQLPKTLSLNRDRMASIREKLSVDPTNAALASAAAAGYIKMGNDESDPRFYGYAQSAIEYWWNAELPPANIAKIRAKLKEKDHKYKDAIADLVALLDRQPDDTQAWIEVINLHRVVGDYDAARQSIARLEKLEDEKAIAVASIPLMAATGKANQAYETLATLDAPDLASWIAATQGDIAASLGRFEAADKHYREALMLNSGSIHLKRTYADFLLDHRRPAPVLQLLANHENDNGCLLLMAIAAHRLGKEQLAWKLKSKLFVRFNEIRLRGSQPHGRFESRYELELNNDPKKALVIALENWKIQREVRDARAVLESAVASKNLSAAQPTIKFIKKSGHEDIALAQLISTLNPQ